MHQSPFFLCKEKRPCKLQNLFLNIGVKSHHHQPKVFIYPLNENFLSLQIVTLRSQLIFSFGGHLFFLS
ncbi:hypothetical protein COL30_26060 [Bacillus pseudomycoides]|uniref:Uncharacterized protein n=1 Tax=Bacillus pseudomycoides TaxID=64104 RepID=A0A2B4MVC6_9BACI|nr:hypothetical protein CON79_22995 [Bacillus pseudomycoides]PEA83581.1 hypothetical protein CON99_10795 [Bacillus pseudomycoides]PED07609.1 hypothetical protein COO19_14465 [Bacillus pseudomycoides]PED69616.1 hypothetical protein CON97_24215 [Bacillus pseudomycoides]PEI33945.1 hypothetical protein CN620_26870 [Bacillus pseudomycoides]